MEYNRDTTGEVSGNSMSAKFPFNVDKNWQEIAVRLTNTTESPYLIKKKAQI